MARPFAGTPCATRKPPGRTGAKVVGVAIGGGNKDQSACRGPRGSCSFDGRSARLVSAASYERIAAARGSLSGARSRLVGYSDTKRSDRTCDESLASLASSNRRARSRSRARAVRRLADKPSTSRRVPISSSSGADRRSDAVTTMRAGLVHRHVRASCEGYVKIAAGIRPDQGHGGARPQARRPREENH